MSDKSYGSGVVSSLPSSPVTQEFLDELEGHDRIESTNTAMSQVGGTEIVYQFAIQVGGSYDALVFEEGEGWRSIGSTEHFEEAMSMLQTHGESSFRADGGSNE